MINWKVRFRNPVFLAQLIMAILVPILSYTGMTAQDITTWGTLGGLLAQAVCNPYVLALVAISVFNAVTDPTTRGIQDSNRAMGYDVPNSGDAE